MRRVIILLAALVLLLAAATGLVLTTTHGLRLAVNILGAASGNQITAANYSGSLLGGFEVTSLAITGEDREIRVAKLDANFDVAGLLLGIMDIKYLHISGVELVNKKPSSDTGVQPRKLLPPLRIKMDDFQADNLRVRDLQDNKQIIIKRLALAFSLKGKVLELKTAHMELENADLAGKGRVDFSIPLSIDVTASWKFELNRGPPTSGKLSLKGNSKTLNVIARVDQPFDGSLELVVHDLLKSPTWDGLADLSGAGLAAWNEQLSGITVGGTLKLKGDSLRADLDGLLEVIYKDTAKTGDAGVPFKAVLEVNADGVLNKPGYEIRSTLGWNKLVIPWGKNKTFIKLPSGDLALHVIDNKYDFSSRSSLLVDNLLRGSWELKGRGDRDAIVIDGWQLILGKGSITTAANIDWSGKTEKGDFKINWRNLVYPPAGAAPAVESDGELSLSGNIEDYTLRGHGILKGKETPDVDFHLTGNGNSETVRFNPVTLSLLNGKISGTGKLAWRDPSLLDMSWQGGNLDPVGKWPGWSGKLNLTGVTRINRENNQYRLALNDFNLSGSLRDYPVRLSADATLGKDFVLIRRFNLGSGSSALDVSGSLAPAYDLKWRVAVPDMGNLLPRATGNLNGQGEMSGTWAEPRLAGTLRGSNVQTPWIKAGTIASDVDLDFVNKHNIDLHLELTGLAYKDHFLGDLRFQATGSEGSHVYTLDAGAGSTLVKLSGEGAYAGSEWDGSIQKLLYQAPEFGRWENTETINAYLHGKEIGVRNGCMKSQASSLCLAAAWKDAGNWNGRLTLKAMPLNTVNGFLPDPMHVNGRFDLNLEGNRESGKAPFASGKLALAPGVFSFSSKPDADEQVAFSGGRASFRLHDAVAETDMALNFEEPGVQPLKAAFMISGLNTFPVDPAGVSLNGSLSGSIEDLAFTSSLTPYVADVGGKADVNLKIRGKLAQPDVSGLLQLSGVEFLVPDLGVGIKNMNITGQTTAPGKFELKGQFQSGEGTTRMLATLSENDEGLPVIISHLDGERFEAINLPELWALASPDVDLKLAGDSGTMTGKVLVTDAVIDLDEIADTATTSLSGDVVLSDREIQKTKSESPGKLDTRLQVEFGDNIKVRGKGITGNVKGALEVFSGKDNEMLGNGEIRIENGQFSAYGQSLTIEEGKLVYRKAKLDNPELSIKAVRHVGDVTAGVNVAGYMTDPIVTLFSTPAMSEDEALSYVVFGRPLSDLSTGEGTDLIGAATSLGLQNSGFITKSLGTKLGIDTLKVETNGSAKDASLVIGKYLTPRLYLSYGIGLFQSLSTAKLRYDLSRHWELEAEHGTEMGADVLYKIEK